MRAKRIDEHCSFCGKRRDQVSRLVAGPGVFICDQCVALCSEIISAGPPAPTRPGPPGRASWIRSLRSGRWFGHLFQSVGLQTS